MISWVAPTKATGLKMLCGTSSRPLIALWQCGWFPPCLSLLAPCRVAGPCGWSLVPWSPSALVVRQSPAWATRPVNRGHGPHGVHQQGRTRPPPRAVCTACQAMLVPAVGYAPRVLSALRASGPPFPGHPSRVHALVAAPAKGVPGHRPSPRRSPLAVGLHGRTRLRSWPAASGRQKTDGSNSPCGPAHKGR